MVEDLFITPTAVAFADLVIPCAMSPERDCLRVWFDPLRTLTKACSQYGECKSDETIMIELGHKIHPEAWPEHVVDDRSYMNWRLERDGVVDEDGSPMTMETVEEKYHGMWYHHYNYRKYEKGMLRPTARSAS